MPHRKLVRTFENDEEAFIKKLRRREYNAQYQRKRRLKLAEDKEASRIEREKRKKKRCERRRKLTQDKEAYGRQQERDKECRQKRRKPIAQDGVTYRRGEKQQNLSSSSSTDQPQLFKIQVLPAQGLVVIKQETTDATEVPSLSNETLFIKADPSVLIYYRDNAPSMAQEDPLETLKIEPKTEYVDYSEIAQDELIIKDEILDDCAVTDEKIS